MRRLMLLRHAKTETDAPTGQDQDRRLDDRGRLDSAAIGSWIGRHPPFPDIVLVSTAVRAHQTWEIAREAMKELAPQPVLGLAGERVRQPVVGALPNQADDVRRLLLGHPGDLVRGLIRAVQ